MMASELIKNISILIQEHGDLPIYLEDWNEGYAPHGMATEVKYETDKFVLNASE